MATWSWADDSFAWSAYAPAVCAQLDAAFADPSKAEVPLNLFGLGPPSHTINLERMQQINLRTQMARPVRREVVQQAGVPGVGAWCFQDERGRWVAYDEMTSATVSAAYAAGRSGTVVYVAHTGQLWPYLVDLRRSQQINAHTKMQRPIRFDKSARPQPVRQPGDQLGGGYGSGHGGGHGGGHAGGHGGSSFYQTPASVYGGAPPHHRRSGDGGGGSGHKPRHPLAPPWRRDFAATAPGARNVSALVKWRVLPPGAYAGDGTDPIMMSTLGEDGEEVVQMPCHTEAVCCVFNKSTVEQAFQSSNACPSCGTRYPLPGPQPSGTMSATFDRRQSCEGHHSCGTFVLEYSFPNGTQLPQHPKPGAAYTGTHRTVFLPDDTTGRQCLALLVAAFDQGLLFRVGNSSTTGREDVVVWAIHQKTSPGGGPTQHGWPDDGYLQRLKSECAAAGVHGALLDV